MLISQNKKGRNGETTDPNEVAIKRENFGVV
jgi:hypothetical protein